MPNDKKILWQAAIAAVLVFYAAAAVLALHSGLAPRPVRLALLVLALHVLEIPLAFRQLAGRNAQPLRVVVATLLFGLLWWIPAKRGLFAVA